MGCGSFGSWGSHAFLAPSTRLQEAANTAAAAGLRWRFEVFFLSGFGRRAGQPGPFAPGTTHLALETKPETPRAQRLCRVPLHCPPPARGLRRDGSTVGASCPHPSRSSRPRIRTHPQPRAGRAAELTPGGSRRRRPEHPGPSSPRPVPRGRAGSAPGLPCSPRPGPTAPTLTARRAGGIKADARGRSRCCRPSRQGGDRPRRFPESPSPSFVSGVSGQHQLKRWRRQLRRRRSRAWQGWRRNSPAPSASASSTAP